MRIAPAPWHVIDRYDGSRTVAVMRDFRQSGCGTHVEADRDWVGSAHVDVILANAQVVAAAPEMLAALKEILQDIESGFLVRNVTRDGEPGWTAHMLAFVRRLQAAQSAVLKAEGGTR